MKVNLVVPVNDKYLFLIYMTIVLSCNILLWFTENELQLHSYHTNKQYDKVLFESFESRRSQHLHERLRLCILAKITRSWQAFVLALLDTINTPCIHSSETFQTPSKYLPHNTPSRHLLNTYHTRDLPHTFQIPTTQHTFQIPSRHSPDARLVKVVSDN